jgi:hypothetical protein
LVLPEFHKGRCGSKETWLTLTGMHAQFKETILSALQDNHTSQL